jgi:hypothetical protein
MRQKGKRTKGIEQAQPFEEMSTVNPHAAGVEIGAEENEHPTLPGSAGLAAPRRAGDCPSLLPFRQSCAREARSLLCPVRGRSGLR